MSNRCTECGQIIKSKEDEHSTDPNKHYSKAYCYDALKEALEIEEMSHRATREGVLSALGRKRQHRDTLQEEIAELLLYLDLRSVLSWPHTIT